MWPLRDCTFLMCRIFHQSYNLALVAYYSTVVSERFAHHDIVREIILQVDFEGICALHGKNVIKG